LLVVAALALACTPGSATPPAREAAPAGAAASGPTAAATPAQLVPVRIAYSELTPAQAPNWVAYEAGIYARHGIDAQLSYIASAQSTTAVLAGDIDVGLGGGYAVMSSRLAGSDLLLFLGVTTFYPYVFMAAPSINTPNDLRGKPIGISRFGSSSDIATRVALKHLGLDADTDVTLIQVNSLADRFAAMQSGAIAAGLASPPQPITLRRLGFKEFLDLALLDERTLNNMGFATGSWLRDNATTAQALTNALVEAIHYTKTHPTETQRVLSQYLKIDDPEELADAYDFFITQHMRRLPDPAVDAGREFLESQAATDPRAASARTEDFFDLRFVQQAAQSGLVERLYGGQ
jgi:NitT/TauT family transport system substrate-binding protein